MATNELDQLWVTNPTRAPFTVKWAGVPYTVQPRQKIIWQRFLAEHFAKYLADSILLKKEEEHHQTFLDKGGSERDYQPKSYINSKKLRPPIISSILVGVYSYHTPQNVNDPTAVIQQQIDAWNKDKQPDQDNTPVRDTGTVPTGTTGGVLQDTDDPEDAADEDKLLNEIKHEVGGTPPPETNTNTEQSGAGELTEALGGKGEGTSQQEPSAKPTRQELFQEAKRMGIKTSPNMSNKQIEDELKKQFA